ncbi:MAG: AMP-binding protein [Acidimicrobiales bacterium]
MNLASLIDPHPAARRALCGTEGWLNWGDVRRWTGSVASGLTGLGVGPADRVAIAWPTSMEFVVAYLAVLATGAVAVPLNPDSPAPEFERELAFVDPAVVICGGRCVETITGLAASGTGGKSNFPRVVTSSTGVTGSSGSSGSSGSPGSPGSPGSSGGATSLEITGWDQLLASKATGDSESGLQPVERASTDPAVLLFTSGTSASPRAATLTHGNLIANLRQMLAVPGMMLGKDDVGLAAVPLFHVFGLNVVLGLTLATGAALVCEERFEPEAALRLVEERGVTVVAGAPPMFADWAELPDAHHQGFAGVRLLLSGAAALPSEVEEKFNSRFGMSLRQGYGLTEASPGVATSVGIESPSPGSVGRPLPGVSIRLVDDSGDDALYDDPGEIWVRGANVFSGYWHDDEATRQVLDQDGWLRTGDVGVLDDSGELHIVDRLKDIIIVSGFNVIPAEVEQVVRGVDGVKEAVVVGRPDPRTGESVEAVVVTEPGTRLAGEQIIEFSRTRLAHYKVPATVRFVEALPHGLTGKALRRVVRETA